MTRIPPYMIAVSTSLAAPPKDWAVPGAPWRVALHAGSAPGTPEAGWEIRLPDFGSGRADMRDTILLDSGGKEIALDAVWRGSGSTSLMLAESMPEKAGATLYFGGNTSRRMKSSASSNSRPRSGSASSVLPEASRW